MEYAIDAIIFTVGCTVGALYGYRLGVGVAVRSLTGIFEDELSDQEMARLDQAVERMGNGQK